MSPALQGIARSVQVRLARHARAIDAGRQAQWRAFLDKNRLQGPDLADLISGIRDGLGPTFEQARREAMG